MFQHIPNTGDENDFEAAIRALNSYFDPHLNPDRERFRLRQSHRGEDESVDVYYGRLRRTALSCTGFDKEDEVRAQFIQGCKSGELRWLVLQSPE